MEEKKYTTTDVSKKINVSDRTVRRYIDKEISKIDGKYMLSEDAYNFIVNKYSSDNSRTTHGQPADTENNDDEFDIIEAFSQEEYLEFQKRLTEYPLLKEKIEESKDRLNESKEYIQTLLNELDYHKKTYHKHLEMHQKMIDVFQQRNFIEAKEKGLDQ
ncbi:hypothetical protein [Empedobacter sp.]|uniref:hypothetical protein n=1 Tax=Empedobacter sp. TaxID=1927715 RepID=UPI00289D803F|nr:hypothetical protein [Empedobacter sp.]